MNVFVTVGTTEFDELLNVLVTPKVINSLIGYGFTSMTVQKGQGKFTLDLTTLSNEFPKFTVTIYDKKPSLDEDMRKSDLIISHGGSGCIFESLHHGRKLITVINESLMGNHQEELSEELEKQGYPPRSDVLGI
jgi:beta-1,4-N-acetylglucosaminyltransferase